MVPYACVLGSKYPPMRASDIPLLWFEDLQKFILIFRWLAFGGQLRDEQFCIAP